MVQVGPKRRRDIVTMGDKGANKGKCTDPDVVRFEERARNLERAAQDMQKMLQQLASEKAASASATAEKTPKNKGNRGSKSMTNLSSDKNIQPKESRAHGWHGKTNKPQQQQGFRQSLGPVPPYQGPNYRPRYSSPHTQGPPSYQHEYPPNYGGQMPPPLSYAPPPYRFSPQHGPQFGTGYFNQPPPSYEESKSHSQYGSTQHSEKQPKQKSQNTGLTPEAIVKAIVLFEGQWTTCDILSRQVQKSEQEVAEVVKSRKDIFSYMVRDRGLVIELVPKINLCSDYLSEDGCASSGSCKALHMCKTFVTAYCDAGTSCQYGHRWDTNHNNSVLSKLYLDLIDKRVLHQVMRKVCKGTASQICSFYNSKNGCKRNENCNNIHICKDFVMNCGKCSVSDCSLNHDILNDHCKRLLKRFGISVNESPRDILMSLMSLVKNQEESSTSTSSMKSNTSKSEGKGEKIKKSDKNIECKDEQDSDHSSTSVEKKKSKNKKKGKKSDGKDNKGEDEQNEMSQTLSDKPKSEGKKQAKKSKASKSEAKEASASSSKSEDKSGKKKKGKSSSASSKDIQDNQDNPSSDSENDSDSSEHSDITDKNQKKDGKSVKGNNDAKAKQKNKRQTIYSSDVYGDVEVPEICIYAVNDKCINVKKGCRFLHAKSLFHWQFENEGKWYNFRIFQSKTLENAYRDVDKSGIMIPPLDPSKLESNAKELLNILGTESWRADFKEQYIQNSSGSEHLKIRRISTRSAGESEGPKSTVYDWYFSDDQGKWIRYGEVDSLGKQELVCNITSEEVEKQYLSDPSSSMLISNAQFQYKLDFAKMTQTNLKTNKAREIRRRPSRLSCQKKVSSSDQSSLPDHWIAMGGNETHILVPLGPANEDYQEVSSHLRLMLPNANIQKIERLQNPYLWRLFQYKKAFLSQRYDENQLNVQKLFHGTDSAKIDTVCKENIDWRQGITVEQNFGKGTYFSNSAAIARRHSTINESGHYVLILAEVIIGSVIKGSPTLTRPPANISNNTFYDTTVDDVDAPTIFVKYDKEEYYPEYIIEFF
ncbi:protein mono-ADP-ribosyltransferase PARP12 isoform X2 [Cherax quadricarinatus]|uniref:protein mono-ADP-ribosyltransferase PARP12 isoform X2 n=1 Tax=Cherax quadricarinatus TaxID=27406 RepID=UPI002379BB19|nr:protein mono-ADP-ribosyltransferase PARP12-like isoform X2 [Cherax quadricarinatus]